MLSPKSSHRAIPSTAEILALCEQRINTPLTSTVLKQMELTRRQLNRRIAHIVTDNLASGRGWRIMPKISDSSVDQLASYIDRVIATYLAEHNRIERLETRNEIEWRDQFVRLERLARRMLRRYGLSATMAADFAQQTCETIFDIRFPCDVPFDAWSALILKNHIRSLSRRSRDAIDHSVDFLALDASVNLRRNVREELSTVIREGLSTDLTGEQVLEDREAQRQLLAAIGQLPSAEQQQVIICGFLLEMTDTEIAEQLGRTRQAVYNLRHRALRELKQKLKAIKE